MSLELLLKSFRLPAFAEHHHAFAKDAEEKGWGFLEYLRRLAETEAEERKRRKIERLQKKSGIPAEKTLGSLDQARLPTAIRRRLPGLLEGNFVEQAENVLVFGLPGRGKSHLVSAIGHELVRAGYGVLFVPTFRLVQRLLQAKRDLDLEKELKRLDVYDVVILDDIGYVQQSREEMEILFTFLSERYERRSVMITSNLVFSQWDKIFKDAMTTAAAIDRLVHHAVILEMTGESHRAQSAKTRNRQTKTKEVSK
jgi:DNA replication protein DnaC